MPVLPGKTMMDLDMDYDSIRQAGSGLGSGAVMVMNESLHFFIFFIFETKGFKYQKQTSLFLQAKVQS